MSAALWTQRLRLFGDALRDHRRAVLALQWSVAGLYLVLQIGPLLAPHSDLAFWRDALFWGVWEPGALLAALLLGPIWCGLLCPDGVMTETASHVGLGRKPAAWMRPAILPLLLFAGVTFFGAIFDAHGAPWGALILVGGPSLAAIAAGLVYGRGKRVWCRHLCPVAGLFALLSRCAPLHFAVDRAAWDAAPRPPKPVDCPLLIDVRRMTSIDKCSLCGQCSSYRGAVALSWRAPGSEISTLRDEDLRESVGLAIAFILFGLSFSAPHGAGLDAPFWARGAAILGGAALLGALTLGLTWLGAGGARLLSLRLVYALIPLGGLGLVAGMLERSFALLSFVAPAAQILCVAAGALWSFALGARALPLANKILFALTCLILAGVQLFPLVFFRGGWPWPI
jgi:hypothetical protein